MKEKKKSPDKYKQAKITAFCLGSPDENGPGRIGKKRKNSDEHVQGGKKRLASPAALSPDVVPSTPDNDAKENLDDLFRDLESDAFSSPKKTILGSSSVWEANGKSGLDFGSPKKCKVTSAFFDRKNKFELVLTVTDEKSKEEAVCKLREVWTSQTFAVGDVVSIHATRSDGDWLVDNKSGYVILHPDVSITSTALVRSMFCLRQGVLSYFFKDADPQSKSRMLLGRLVHELFQDSLRKGPRTGKDFAELIEAIVGSRDNLRDLLFSDVSVSEVRREMEGFVPRIRDFLETYVNKEARPEGRNYDGTIEDVLDIEETVKSPTLGFQGRIDVSVKVRSKNAESVAPLELKTGRASFSSEHRSQLILYVLLMKELGRKVDSGLLLYLREGVLEEIKPQRDDVRNLFLLRNHFASYVKTMKRHRLPDPVKRTKNCRKCPLLRVCTAYLRGEEGLEGHPLAELAAADVKPSHVDYFLKWCKMLWLENEDAPQGEGELSGLRLDSSGESRRDELTHFARDEKSGRKGPRSGTNVHVTDGEGNRLCTGQVIEVTESRVTVATEKKLSDFSASYKIAPAESNFLSFYLSNLGWLLEERRENLREIVIERKPPTFEKRLKREDFVDKCLGRLMDLNRDQQKAVLKSLLCKDYLLIKGPPGTGKTQTIAALIRILVALGQRVLLAGHTHTSIDNVLLRVDEVEYLRLGAGKSIHEGVVKNSYWKLAEDCGSVEELRKVFERKLIASTCMGIDSDFIERNKVDVCIVDESSQVLQPEILRPLFCSGKFILVGDDDQLPPIVRNSEAKSLGMDKSLFESLMSDRASVRLRLQYRMNSVINSLANAIAYGGAIECANEEVATATMKIPNPGARLGSEPWVADVLSDELEKSVVFVDTSEHFRGKEGKKGSGERQSALEANLIAKLVASLIRFGVRGEDIGIIAPFWDQVALLKKKLREENLRGIELNTVDQYQGRDKDVIFFSCTKENQRGKRASDLELLSDKRRLTVAVTRAKHKLVILGDRDAVVNYRPFQKLTESLRESQFYALRDGRGSFRWDDFVL